MAATEPCERVCEQCGHASATNSAGDDLGCMVCLLQVGLDEPDSVATPVMTGAIGVYRIEQNADGTPVELGRGAMGVTYRATDTSLQRAVALKMIEAGPTHLRGDVRQRFMREARAAASLRHPNIATVYQFGIREETGQCFYAMELVEGETLEERVRRVGPLDSAATIALAQQIVGALRAAETQGLVHRDLKPANLMLISPEKEAAGESENLRVKVIDFGLAKAITSELDPMSLTKGEFVGTPAFASPEQFLDVPLDVRSDIYSLGVTLWFALTGKTPYHGRSIEEVRSAQRSTPLPLDQLKASRAPKSLVLLLQSMLALEPAARPSTRRLADALKHCQAPLPRYRRIRWLAASATLIAALGAVAFFTTVGPRGPGDALLAQPVKSVAVFPFTSPTDDPDSGYFAAAMQDQILSRLAKIADLKVVTRSSTPGDQGSLENLAEVARQLGVAHVVEGSVQKSGDHVHIGVQLIDAGTKASIWAETFDPGPADLLRVEGEAAGHIATALEAKLTAPEKRAIKTAATSSSEAYQTYLKGRYFWNKRTEDGLKQARDYFKQAIALDPNYAEAYVGLGDADQFLAASDANTSWRDEGYAESKAANRTALELDPSLADAHASLGLVAMNYDFDWATAEAEFKRALELNPNYATAHQWYAALLSALARHDESLAEVELARRLDPVSLIINTDLGCILFYARRTDDAIAQLRETLKLDANFGGARYWLGRAYAENKRYDDALAEFNQGALLSEADYDNPMDGFVYGLAGQREKAERILARWNESTLRSPASMQSMLCLYIGLGDKEAAIANLEEQYRLHSTGMTSLKVNPIYDSLRSDPRFTDLMRRVHLAP